MPFSEVSSQSNLDNGKLGSRQQLKLELMQPFKLNVAEIKQSDGVVRVYIDEFKDVGGGKLYKGQWDKKMGQRDGVGI